MKTSHPLPHTSYLIPRTSHLLPRTSYLIPFFAFCLNVACAQKTPAEFSIFGGGGFSFHTFNNTLKEASSLGYNADIGLGFTGFAGAHVGFHIGAGFGMFNVKAKNINVTHITTWSKILNGSDFDFDLHTTLCNYTEKQKVMFLTIPLMIQFQTKINQGVNWKKGERVGFYALGGIKLNFLFNNTCEKSMESFYRAAYCYELDNWADSQEFAELGETPAFSSQLVAIKTALLPEVAAEAGVKWRIGQKVFLYTGAFLDYALTDPAKKQRKPIEEYMIDGYQNNTTLLKYSNRVNLMHLGLKVRLAFFKVPKNNACPY